MKQIFTTVTLLCTIIIPYLPLSAQWLSTDGKTIVNEQGDAVLLRGMGLGGWMLQEGYMLQTAGFANPQHQIRAKITDLIGESDTDLFYEAWLKNHVRKIDIDSLKAWGFNSVRLPMHYNLFTLPIEEEAVAGEHTWLTKGFELTDSLLKWCEQNEMYVILDLHAAPGGQGRDEGISDYDSSKPSLWESQANRDKTVALWKKLAETYADEPWIAGYDLINETNWNMDGNIPLRDLYYELTDSIRAVDDRHMLFIEGNWFANDFTNLTPPWDDNMVYSPHKYWSINDQASIQWVLDIREQFDVPLYFGESGENSNPWFRDAIRLFEEHDIGWAWWPLKKIESIAGPLSIEKTPDYQALLDYWDGNGTQPNAATAKTTLMQLTEDLKLENCRYQKDVIDAMFRQVYSDETVPYRIQTIPGIVYATDFDMGAVGAAYHDDEIANFQVSTGNYTAWNNGWSYRNDGVDIETTMDNVNSNGYNIGWMTTGEWLQYSVDVAEHALYEVQIRIAANSTNGRLHLSVGDADISGSISVPNSGGWQNWQTITIPNVILMPDDKKIRFHVDAEGFNLNSLEFIQGAESSTFPTRFVSAFTADEQHIQLNFNKPLLENSVFSASDFQVFINGTTVPIRTLELDATNSRILRVEVDYDFKSSDVIRMSYSGDAIEAQDGTALSGFSQRLVQNTIAIIHAIPGRVQAEDYFFQQGIQLESTTDAGSGENIGFLDIGDYADYYINVEEAGVYEVTYRTAALSEQGQIQLQLVDGEITTDLHTVNFPATGGWQTWGNTTQRLNLPEGQHQLRLNITQPLFNINWFEFSSLTSSTKEEVAAAEWSVFPNPSDGVFYIQNKQQQAQLTTIKVYNLLGQVVFVEQAVLHPTDRKELDLSALPLGHYYLGVKRSDGAFWNTKLLRMK